MSNRITFLASFVVAVVFTLSAVAQEYTLVGTTDKPDGIYACGETITFSIQLLADGKPQAGTKLKYTLKADGDSTTNGELTSALEPVSLQTKLDFPGWTYVLFTPVDAEGKTLPVKARSSRGVGAMVEPEKITYAGQKPADYDAFWAARRAELDKVPVKATLTRIENAADGFELYDVQVECAGPKPVSGYLSVPIGAAPKSCPAVVSYHGAGVRSSSKPYRKGVISLDVNAHGLPNAQPAEFYTQLANNELKGYPHFNKDNRDEFYFNGMMLRVMRALDYIKTRPEWDGKTLVAYGSSQGGGQAIAAAALDKQVTLCVASVPALSDHAGTRATPRRQAGWPRLYAVAADGSMDEATAAIARTAEYFDNVNFATRITCETYLSTGFVDLTCVPTSVYAVYNSLPATTRKVISVFPNGTHTSQNPKGMERMKEVLPK
ncbi:MAG TPA: acetylxylan esterase [Lentisphaeria bacterium]|nr:acetylxylan esterase [Lentisphaeria bacterium]